MTTDLQAPHWPAGPTGVATTARMLARAQLVEAFGHVSERHTDGGFLLTSTAPLASQDADEINHISDSGEATEGAVGVPLERYLHAAIYSARPDVNAICRTHSPAAVDWGARGETPPLVHGLGGLAGTVSFFDEIDLVADSGTGLAAANALGDTNCLLARGNGAVTTGGTLAEAFTRAWFLEERARVAAVAGPSAREIAPDHPRLVHVTAEYPRAWRWLDETFGSGRVL